MTREIKRTEKERKKERKRWNSTALQRGLSMTAFLDCGALPPLLFRSRDGARDREKKRRKKAVE
jgi:hypothetical protein